MWSKFLEMFKDGTDRAKTEATIQWLEAGIKETVNVEEDDIGTHVSKLREVAKLLT